MNSIDFCLNKVHKELFSNSLVVDFFNTRNCINNNIELQEIIDKMHYHQKRMSLSMENEELYKKEKELYEIYQSSYNSHPLIVNYNFLQTEIYNLLSQIADFLNK